MLKNMSYLLFCFLVSGPAQAVFYAPNDGIVSTTNGGEVSFPAGLQNPLWSYSAVVVAGTNVDSVTTPATLFYYPVSSNHIRVFGTISVNPTSGAAATNVTISLPKPRSTNFSGTTEAFGTASPTSAAALFGPIHATDAAKTVTVRYISGGTSAESVAVDFVYEKA